MFGIKFGKQIILFFSNLSTSLSAPIITITFCGSKNKFLPRAIYKSVQTIILGDCLLNAAVVVSRIVGGRWGAIAVPAGCA